MAHLIYGTIVFSIMFIGYIDAPQIVGRLGGSVAVVHAIPSLEIVGLQKVYLETSPP